MRILPLILLLAAALLAACAPVTAIPSPDGPVTSETPLPEPALPPYAPQPGDTDLLRAEIYLDSTELLVAESYPLQFFLALKGSLPTPCHQLRVDVQPPDEQNRIKVDLYAVTGPEEMCIQVLEPFELNLPLGSFPTGKYQLWLNGEQAFEFDA